MVETGVLHENDRVELLGGELVPMSPKEYFHERMKAALIYFLVRGLPDAFRAIPETTFYLSDDTFIEPDFVIFPKERGLKGLKGPEAALAIEIAVTSLSYDLKRKPRIYAHFRIPELWVVDAKQRILHVHREPDGEAYRSVTRFETHESAEALLIPGLKIALGDLDLEI